MNSVHPDQPARRDTTPNAANRLTAESAAEHQSARPSESYRASSHGDSPRVAPGQIWNDDSVRRPGGPLLVISVDSAYAYCRDGREGDGDPRRIALAWFDERRRGGLTLVSADGLEDLVERRTLTALWELDYLGSPTTSETICALLGGFYPLPRVERALADAEAEGLVLRSEGEWRLTGGGRRIAAAA